MAAPACVLSGLGPRARAAWEGLEQGEAEEGPRGQGAAPPPPGLHYGIAVGFGHLDDVLKGYGLSADEAMEYGRRLEATERLDREGTADDEVG